MMEDHDPKLDSDHDPNLPQDSTDDAQRPGDCALPDLSMDTDIRFHLKKGKVKKNHTSCYVLYRIPGWILIKLKLIQLPSVTALL